VVRSVVHDGTASFAEAGNAGFFAQVADEGETLEVCDPLSVAVSEHSESLFVDIVDLGHVSGNEAFSSILSLDDQIP
jgi:hypothetical protein